MADQPTNLKEAAATAFKTIDAEVDWRTKLKSFGQLTLVVFSLFFLVMAPFELYQVYTVNNLEPQPARLITVQLEPPTFGKGQWHWRYHFEYLKTGERDETGDVRPGDLPFSTLGWSTADWDAARYHAGQEISVYRAAEGGHPYLERGGYGFMSAILAAALAYWAVLIKIMVSRRHIATSAAN